MENPIAIWTPRLRDAKFSRRGAKTQRLRFDNCSYMGRKKHYSYNLTIFILIYFATLRENLVKRNCKREKIYSNSIRFYQAYSSSLSLARLRDPPSSPKGEDKEGEGIINKNSDLNIEIFASDSYRTLRAIF